MKHFFVAAILICYTLSQELAGGKYNPDSNDRGLFLAITYVRMNFRTACNLPDYDWDSVISTQAQVVKGDQYFITAKVTRGNESKTIIATVWFQPRNQKGQMDISITNCNVR